MSILLPNFRKLRNVLLESPTTAVLVQSCLNYFGHECDVITVRTCFGVSMKFRRKVFFETCLTTRPNTIKQLGFEKHLLKVTTTLEKRSREVNQSI